MAASFLTHHGTFLCFGEGRDFQHLPIDQLDGAALVLADADVVSLRSGGDGSPVSIRPAAAARIGLPRAIGIGRGNRASTVSLDWRDGHLGAGGEGGVILRSERVNEWEEFLPIASEDVTLLRAFDAGWESVRDRRRFGRGEIRPAPAFMLRAGEMSIDLRLMPTLGGGEALRTGRASLLVDGWRVETLRRYEPLVVWRHDGSDQADDEIVLGLRSLVEHPAFAGRMLIETRLELPDLLGRAPGLQAFDLEVRRPPEGRRGLLPWPLTDDSATPVLHLANGILCRGGLEPLLQALVEERGVALLPWVWATERTPSLEQEVPLFCRDPAEASGALACSAAIIGVPNRERSRELHRLISTIAANRLGPVMLDDGIEDDLLRYVVARAGDASTRLLSRYASDARSGGTGSILLNYRSLPVEVRTDALRGALDERDGKSGSKER